MSTTCLASSFALWLLAPTAGICGLILAVWSWRRRRPDSFDTVVADSATEMNETPAGEAGFTERRHEDRRWGPPVAVLLAEAKVVAPDHGIVCFGGSADQAVAFAREPVEAWVLNRSKDGLCLSAQKSSLVGSAILVRIAVGSKDAPWVKLEVTHCSAVDLRWRLGCRFCQTPPANVLALFG